MDFTLHPVEVRVLGSLIEKDVTTPEYYPMTLNALVNACNQKSNRDPAVTYDDETVQRALESLRAKGLSGVVTGAGNRVPKFNHRFSERLNLGRAELAVMCELMLRGPQTVGELRSRAARMYEFSGIDAVESCLRGLMDRQPDPWVARLPHLPGTKEPRYVQLLSGEPDLSSAQLPHAAADGHQKSPDRVEKLEQEFAALRQEFDWLKQQMADFRKQFE